MKHSEKEKEAQNKEDHILLLQRLREENNALSKLIRHLEEKEGFKGITPMWPGSEQ